MEDDYMDIYQKLVNEIILLLNLEPKDLIVFDPSILKDSIYVFYLDCKKSLTRVAIKSACDILRNNFALYVLFQKQTFQELGIESRAIKESLTLLTESLINLINSISEKKPEEILLLNVDSTVSSVDQSNVRNSICKYVTGEILKGSEYLTLLKSDLDSQEESKYCETGLKLIDKQIAEWSKTISKVQSGVDNNEIKEILNSFKKRREDFQYLISSIIALDDCPMDEEIEELEELIENLGSSF